MEKITFREVIANIKKGEVWESYTLRISLSDDDCIEIRSTTGELEDGIIIWEEIGFALKRKEYTFEEAFKTYEEGKEIESLFNCCRYKKESGVDLFQLPHESRWRENEGGFFIREIREKWYINN